MTDTTDQFKFLDDSPVEDDQFGGHKKVADCIAREVEKDPSEKEDLSEKKQPARTIGLEGTWGSGKSSIICMLEKKWENENNIQVFAFDAWEHQGDPLRRIFLEKLIGFLTNCKWLRTRQWKKELEKLARLYEEQDVTSTPYIKPLGFVFALLWLLYSLNQKLFEIDKNTPLYRNIGFWLLAISFLIIAVYAGTWLWRGIMWLTKSTLKIFGNRKRLRGARLWCEKQVKLDRQQNVFALFLGKSSTRTSIKTYRDPRPTSIEFSGVFTKIIKAALLTKKKRRLLIVIDNLDRVSTGDALAIWATMKTFVKSSHALRSDGLWVVVPYAPDGVDKLWGGGDGDGDGEDMAQAFKEKTFQIRYRVAMPLASRWEDYFKTRLAEALPKQRKNVQHAIYHIFRIQGLPAYKRRMPTPREMKMFINRMVTLAQQHYPDVSLPEIALYAATELSEPDVLEDLADKAFKKGKHFAGFLTEQWKEGLAAIYFGVARENAREALYEPIIRKHLSEENSKDLQELLKNTCAQQCFENLLDTAGGMSLVEILTASIALQDQNDNLYIRGSKNRLTEWIENSKKEKWAFDSGLSPKNVQGVINLMDYKPAIRSDVHKHLSVSLVIPDSQDTKRFNVETWGQAVTKIISYLASQEGFDPTLYLQMPYPQYFELLKIIAKEDAKEENAKRVLRYFCPDGKVKDEYFNKYFSQFGNHITNAEDVNIVNGLLQMKCYKDEGAEEYKKRASLVASSIEKNMKQKSGPEQVIYAIKILHEQVKEGSHEVFEPILKKPTTKKHVLETLHNSRRQPENTAFCIAIILLYFPKPDINGGELLEGGKRVYRDFLDNPKAETVKKIAEYCKEFGGIEKINAAVKGAYANSSEGMTAIRKKLEAGVNIQ